MSLLLPLQRLAAELVSRVEWRQVVQIGKSPWYFQQQRGPEFLCLPNQYLRFLDEHPLTPQAIPAFFGQKSGYVNRGNPFLEGHLLQLHVHHIG